jgi:hypothetical protein
LPIRVLAFRHDGKGYALGKMRTNLGRVVSEIETGQKVAEPPVESDSPKKPD